MKIIHTYIKWFLVLIAILISIGFFILPYITNAAASLGAYRPFGGRITSTTMGNVTCPGTGPITIQPVGNSLSGSYWATPGKGGSISAGAWVLGLHSISTDTSCQQQNGPARTPYPAYKWFIYGTSR